MPAESLATFQAAVMDRLRLRGSGLHRDVVVADVHDAGAGGGDGGTGVDVEDVVNLVELRAFSDRLSGGGSGGAILSGKAGEASLTA